MPRLEHRPRGVEALAAAKQYYAREEEKYKCSPPEILRAARRVRDRDLAFKEAMVHIAGLPYETLHGSECEMATSSFEHLNLLRKRLGVDQIIPDLDGDMRILSAEQYDDSIARFDRAPSLGICFPSMKISFLRKEENMVNGNRFRPKTLVHEVAHLFQKIGDIPGVMHLVNEGLTETVCREIMVSMGVPFVGTYQNEVELVAHIKTAAPEIYTGLQRYTYAGELDGATKQFYIGLINIAYALPNPTAFTARELLEALKRGPKEKEDGATTLSELSDRQMEGLAYAIFTMSCLGSPPADIQTGEPVILS